LIESLRRVLRICLGIPRWLRLLLALSWAAAIWWSSSGSVTSGEPEFWQIFLFNGAHVFIYGVLALLIYLALYGLAKRPLLYAFLLSTIYGGVDELHQMTVPERHPSALDLLSDALGSALSLIALIWVQTGERKAGVYLIALALISILVVYLASLS
jgi:VanZ family protein